MIEVRHICVSENWSVAPDGGPSEVATPTLVTELTAERDRITG